MIPITVCADTAQSHRYDIQRCVGYANFVFIAYAGYQFKVGRDLIVYAIGSILFVDFFSDVEGGVWRNKSEFDHPWAKDGARIIAHTFVELSVSDEMHVAVDSIGVVGEMFRDVCYGVIGCKKIIGIQESDNVTAAKVYSFVHRVIDSNSGF